MYMMNNTTPPNIRSVLEKFQSYCYCDEYHVHQNDDGIPANADKYDGHIYFDIDEALQAISAVVLGCTPEKADPGDYEDWGGEDTDYHKAIGYDEAVDRYTDNLRAVLGGAKENKKDAGAP